ncbi:MAG TPA: PHB depolymerase family esterase [Tepidisphaeraceae bacterium]|nr:PHB depolymerase family esterase [Tepidisphaeraceae bacterium]
MRCLLMAMTLVAMASGLAAEEVKTGAFELRFDERSPQSELVKVAERMGVKTEALRQRAAEAEYDVTRESFDVYVPKAYTGQEAYGLVVWISPGATVGRPAGWNEVLDRHKLLWVGANNSGNDRLPLIRMALALDAAHNMKARYQIDEKRVYIAGLSGGGRVGSMLGVGYPDVFAGGLYIIGCNYYRAIFSREKNGIWQKGFNAPPVEVLAQARRHRHVILEGETDANREQSLAYAEAYRRDGFRYVIYLEVPGMGHEPPNAQWFEKGIAALVEELPAASTQPTTRRVEEPSEADKLVRVSRVFIANGMYAAARTRLERVVTEYPAAPEAQEAKKILEEIKGK